MIGDDRHRKPIDIIRDGVHAKDLRAHGNRAIRSALTSTAMSAQNAGWAKLDWERVIREPQSKLGHQLAMRDATRPRTAMDFAKQLDSAWAWAETQLAKDNKWAKVEARAEAEERANALLELVVRDDHGILPGDCAILAYVATLATKYGSTRVTMPRLPVVEATGLGNRAVRDGTERLIDRGLLHRISRGKRPRPGQVSSGRAAIYDLPTVSAVRAIVVPVNGLVGPPEASRPFLLDPHLGTPLDPPPFLLDPPTPQEADKMRKEIEMTIKAASPEVLMHLLRELAGVNDEAADLGADEETLPNNVHRILPSDPGRAAS